MTVPSCTLTFTESGLLMSQLSHGREVVNPDRTGERQRQRDQTEAADKHGRELRLQNPSLLSSGLPCPLIRRYPDSRKPSDKQARIPTGDRRRKEPEFDGDGSSPGAVLNQARSRTAYRTGTPAQVVVLPEVRMQIGAGFHATGDGGRGVQTQSQTQTGGHPPIDFPIQTLCVQFRLSSVATCKRTAT